LELERYRAASLTSFNCELRRGRRWRKATLLKEITISKEPIPLLYIHCEALYIQLRGLGGGLSSTFGFGFHNDRKMSRLSTATHFFCNISSHLPLPYVLRFPLSNSSTNSHPSILDLSLSLSPTQPSTFGVHFIGGDQNEEGDSDSDLHGGFANKGHSDIFVVKILRNPHFLLVMLYWIFFTRYRLF